MRKFRPGLQARRRLVTPAVVFAACRWRITEIRRQSAFGINSALFPVVWSVFYGLVEREVLGEEGDDLLFDAVGDVVEMVAVIDFRLMGNAVVGENSVELPGVAGDAVVFVAGVKADGFHAAQIGNVLVDHIKRFVGVIFGVDCG